MKRAVWTEVSLRYAREHGQRKLAWVLGAVKDDVEFEGALGALPPGEHLSPARDISGEEVARNDARSSESEDEARRRKRKEEEIRDRLAAWKLFVEAEFRRLRLRQEGQLSGLLGDPMAGESSAALERLAEEDQR